MGQITINIRKEIAKEEKETKKADTEGIQIRKITLEKEIWKIITVYNRKEIMKTIEKNQKNHPGKKPNDRRRF